MAFWYVATGPCWATESTSLRTWSGRARAMPRSDIRASLTFIISVPVEIKRVQRADQDAARLAGRLGHVEHQELARSGSSAPPASSLVPPYVLHVNAQPVPTPAARALLIPELQTQQLPDLFGLVAAARALVVDQSDERLAT